MKLNEILHIVIVASASLTALCILLQARGASLGAGFGASGELFTTRRGLEKNLYDTTIILAVVFVVSLLGSMMV